MNTWRDIVRSAEEVDHRTGQRQMVANLGRPLLLMN